MTAIDMDAFIARIEERQAALGGLSDRATCIAAGLKPGALGDIRRKKSEPTAGRLLALANALKCSVDYLITGRNLPSNNKDSENLSILQQLYGLPIAQQEIIHKILMPSNNISSEDIGILRQLHSLSPEQQAMIRKMLIPMEQSEIEPKKLVRPKGKGQ